jgi:hypothetical protein
MQDRISVSWRVAICFLTPSWTLLAHRVSSTELHIPNSNLLIDKQNLSLSPSPNPIPLHTNRCLLPLVGWLVVLLVGWLFVCLFVCLID